MTDLKVNPVILRKYRKQMGLSLEEAERLTGIRTLAKIEEKGQQPTYKQLAKLAERYSVSIGAFFTKGNELAEQFDFSHQIPQFRTLAKGQEDKDVFHIRRLVVRVSEMRSFLLELAEDEEETIGAFSPPKVATHLQFKVAATKAARDIRGWLGFKPDDRPKLPQWRDAIEAKGVFVFMTRPFNHWSKTPLEVFRGLAINYSPLPIIVINDSDNYRAQLFSLMHELGHLIFGTEVILDRGDLGSDADWIQDRVFSHKVNEEEKFCNRFAAEILVPAELLRRDLTTEFSALSAEEQWQECKNIAERFSVSPAVLCYRLVTFDKITRARLTEIHRLMKYEYGNRSQKSFPVKRNIPKEVLKQYGRIYVRAVLNAFHSQEMTLHKLCQNLDIKQAAHAKKLEELLW